MTIVEFLYRINAYILNPLISLAFALSFIYFIYGVIRFVNSSADDKSSTRVEARNSIMWGIIGMVIMFSVYGIIELILSTFGITLSESAAKIIK